MSFTFLTPKSHRSSSEGPRIGWRSASTLSFGSLSLRRPDTGFSPPVDVYETETEVMVRMEIAGIDPTTVDIVIMQDTQLLVIRGRRTDPAAGQPRKYHNMEIECGEFSRQIRLPGAVAQDGTSAHYEDGFLVVTLLKGPPDEAKPHSVPIE